MLSKMRSHMPLFLSVLAVAIGLLFSLSAERVLAQLRTPPSPVLNARTAKIKPISGLQVAACGRVMCFANGGVATAATTHGSPTVCVGKDDPAYGCGSCSPCLLFQVEGAFCGPTGCDFRACRPGWLDRDGNRANGCEQKQVQTVFVSPVETPSPGRSCSSIHDCASGENCRSGRCMPAACTRDSECDDGAYCNGTERCQPGTSGADARGCTRQAAIVCGPYQTCDESQNQCVLADRNASDRDGDGAIALWAGGDDCDDFDPRRAPGLSEVCDDEGHDEDCDPQTFGTRDRDGDGHHDLSCCNYQAALRYCGDDCNDSSPAVKPGALVCEQDKPYVCSVKSAAGVGRYGELDATSCSGSALCRAQPNGTGVCQ